MNAMNDVAEARASALSLRASAKACTREQGALKFRLTRAAESLDAMVLLAMRGIERIEQLERELRELKATTAAAPPPEAPNSPVLVSDVDVAPLALAARILNMVTDEMDEAGADELRASVQTARTIVQEVFDDLRKTSVRGAS